MKNGMRFLERKNGGTILNLIGSDIMKSKKGLSIKNGLLVENLVKSCNYPLSANSVRDRLWDSWGRNVPTCREIGTFLHLNKNMVKTEKKSGAAEYLWGVIDE